MKTAFHLTLHTGTNDIKSQTPVEILGMWIKNDMTYVDNTNIRVEALQKGGLHLNHTGTIQYEFQAMHEVFLGTKSLGIR